MQKEFKHNWILVFFLMILLLFSMEFSVGRKILAVLIDKTSIFSIIVGWYLI